jgi:hypothetical protein
MRRPRPLSALPDLPALLAGAAPARSDPEAAETAIRAALAAAPNDLDVRLAAYRFYFYAHRYAEALPQADIILREAARRLNIAGDWRQVRPAEADFGALDPLPGLWLQALVAIGYGQLRLGEMAAGRAALDKAMALDPADRFGAGRLLAVLAQADADAQADTQADADSDEDA